MNIEKLAPFAVAVAFTAAMSGGLPRFINVVRKVELQLIQQTKASTWPKAPVLREFKKPF